MTRDRMMLSTRPCSSCVLFSVMSEAVNSMSSKTVSTSGKGILNSRSFVCSVMAYRCHWLDQLILQGVELHISA
ncbi:hypothetical protein [Aeromonas phage vB_AsaM_LPM4]|uniref:Uncharacterized protein n=1 Tax=Aeromonas phage vB_AsaM_LPM4 TaxID=2894367 RepID=A0AAE8YLH6_9CAUD|nr:hypothetical protein PQA71_gp33 [Aeromonas phage vB_AsaM_LPM4]UGC97290.1 hypothetical protein [Aeromonas phage vB_AsaM_LPM4]